MTTAIPELHIEPQLPVLAFNFEQLRAWATGLTERYTSMVVTEDALVEVKKDMADLNRNKAKLEEARKEVVRRVSEPIRSFEAQVKEVVGIFDAAYAGLAGQVKAFEDAQREEKRNKVLELIGECFAEKFGTYDVEWPEFNIPVQDKWLNKTTSLKAVREDVTAIIQRYIEEEQRKASLEQARQDRAAAIENHVKALNQLHGLNLSLSRYLGTGNLDMSIPLSRVLENIEGHFKVEADLRKAEASARAALAETSAPQRPAEPAPAPTPPAQTRAMSIVLEYDTINEAQVKACLETLKPLCVSFGARYR